MVNKLSLGLVTIVMLGSTQIRADERQFNSPDGNLVVTLSDNGGTPTYSVALGGTTMLMPSQLGITTDDGDLGIGIRLRDVETRTVTDDYTLATIKQSNIHYEATEALCHFYRGEAPAFDLQLRISNRDVAFRYRLLPTRNRRVAVVSAEATSFTMPEGTTTFLCPQAKPMGGFARTSPSYETSYSYDQPTGFNGWGEGYTFPCLFRTPGGWVLLSETGTDGNYVACRLMNDGAAAYRIGFPQQGEMNGVGTTTAAVSLPATTPWRTITVGTTLAPIVETTVPWDLVQPKYAAGRDYTYGKGTWSWIIGMDSSCNFDEQRRYIDFAAAMGYRSVLIDALWDVQIGRERIAELARYGREKGVGLFLWYNSNGSWNDAPQSPLGKMDRSSARRAEMRWMQETGILGIKVDFFGGDKQPMMQLYEDILTDANEFGIQVIFHGCTLPRGWERMYPNYVASEAVLASENMHFGQGACDGEARAAATHTFIRNTVGSMDFGGSALNKRYNADNLTGTVRRTSDVYALATAVLFQSSVQHFALAPNNLTDAPAWAIDFMRAVPTTWDEVRYLDGYPGRYAILARRCGNRWYIAGINAQDETVVAKLELSMLGKSAVVNVYADDAKLNGSLREQKLRSGRINVSIPKNGGVVIVGE